LEKEPRPLKLLVPGLPRELPLIVGKAMEKDPSLRYASAEAFAQDLGRFQRGEAILARRSPVAERLLRWSRRNRIAARALAVAALTILLGVGFALWISHRAGLEAIEAARLGAEAAAMREEVRAQHLAPPHDLRASRALLRQTLREIEGRPGVQKTGAGAYAIGTGRELLGDHGGARVAFEEAWQRGFRTPETAVALGEALARQYEQEVSQLSEYDGKIAQASHLAALDRQYAEPARRMLAQGPRGGWQEAYTRGRIALLARDFPLARKQAAEAFAAAPQRYEALMLEGEAWQREAHIALDNLDNQAALAALDRALVPLQRATAWGRSDPGLYELIAYVYRIRSTALLRLGRDPDPAVSEAERFTTLALTLDPDAWPVQMHLGVALQSRAAYLAAIAPKEAVAPIEASLTRLRRAAELAPSELEPLTNLAYGLYVLGVVQGNLGQSERAALEEGVQVAARATALAPDHGNVIFQQALLAQELGNSLREEGTDGSAALRTALAACERLLKMEGVIPAPIRTVLGATLTGLAREDWLAGRDPRANLARAVEVTELARREKPGDPAGAVDLANPINASAEMGLRIGDDVKSILRQGIAACDAVGKASDLGQVRVVRAELVAVEARRQLLTSENPLASITEARMILLGTKSFADEPDTLLTLAQLDLLEGAWRVHAGEDARPTLRAAEHRFQAMLREKPSWQGALDGLAAVFLWRSLDARAHGRPCAALAEAGLAPVQRALALDPRDASRRLLEARLLALSGHEAEAREAREAAAKANRLIRSGAEWKAAASEAGP
jgi:serine/threonine-protein kinase